MELRSDAWYKDAGIAWGLALITLIVFWQTLNNGFVNYDDPVYVYQNPHVISGLRWNNILWAFSTGYAGNWHPLTWISHMMDWTLFGSNPAGHHLTSLLIHIANTCLLFFFLRMVAGGPWQSSLVAIWFAIHPLHVESVAWVAERKDVLCTLFWLLTLICYVRYIRVGTKSAYAWAILAFTAGLMAKPMGVTLPFVLLLMDYWPLNRFHGTWEIPNQIREKAPFFLLMLASCLITLLVQKAGGAVRSTADISLITRMANAVTVYVLYLVKMIWPTKLAVFHPHPGMPAGWKIIGAILILGTITGVAMATIKSRPWIGIGWLWYLGTLVPVIGLVQIGAQAMAERYTYIPLIGIFWAIAWELKHRFFQNRIRNILIIAGAVGSVVIFSIISWFQVQHWKNSMTLFTHALTVTSGNWLAHNNLAFELAQQGKLHQAIVHYHKALAIYPNFEIALNGLGDAYMRTGQLDKAEQAFIKGLQVNPDNADIHYNLAGLYSQTGRTEKSIFHYSQAIRINPQLKEAHLNLGALLSRQGQFQQAITHYLEALRIDPLFKEAHFNLAILWIHLGNRSRGIQHLERAVAIDPQFTPAINKLKELAKY